MSSSLPLLLVGQSAMAMATRLEASGYQTRCWPLPEAQALLAARGPSMEPVLAVVLADEGRELAVPLREQLSGAMEVPLLLEVANDDVAARSHCLNWGASDFWLQDAAPSDLLRRLRLHLQAQQPQPSPLAAPAQKNLLQQGDLRLDPKQRRAWRGQRELQLTAREYALLLVLVERRGETVSREAILEEVWGQSEEQGNGNVIEVYVRYLRRKLEEKGERRLIHTVRGMGYCLRSAPP